MEEKTEESYGENAKTPQSGHLRLRKKAQPPVSALLLAFGKNLLPRRFRYFLGLSDNSIDHFLTGG